MRSKQEEKRPADREPSQSLSELRTCQATLLSSYFSDRPLIIAANRGPVTFERNENGELEHDRGEGGLVTALTGLCHHTDTTWVACARTDADAAWKEGTITLEEEGHDIHLTFLTPSEEAYDGYYNVIANPLLWFLQHSMWDIPHAPIIDRETWTAWEEGYTRVNRAFAEEIARRVRSQSQKSLVMLQDYHLYLTPKFLRDSLPPEERPTILHFNHIPWPGPEYWRILPPTMRRQILEGLCGADLLGFQTREDRLGFLRSCESHLNLPRSSVKYEKGQVWYDDHKTYVEDFPISIDVEALRNLAQSEKVDEYEEEVREIIGDNRLILRIDRIEPSKNIVRGFQAFEEMLELYPEHREDVKFLALLVPSRQEVEEYRDYRDELMVAAGRVNTTYGTSDWEPVRVVIGDNYPRAVAALKMYDVLIVNSIADGMNLVAKEGPVVNERDGVLILSERTGASQQLRTGAQVISPCDVYATANALHRALEIPQDERRELARKLRWRIEREDITTWVCEQISALQRLGL